MGFKYALLEVMLDTLRRCADPTDPGAMMEAIKTTDMKTLVGPVNFQTGPVPNVSQTPVVGGQWVKGSKFPYDLKINENKYAPDIQVQAPFEALKYS